MTKNEIINEMYNVVNNNAGVFCYADKHMIDVHAKYIKTVKKATLEQYLAKLNAMVEEANKAKTVETEVENDTEKNVEDMAKIDNDVLFNVVWGAFRFFHTQEKYVIPCDEFSTLVISMYDTMCGGLDNDKTLDKFLDIVDAMIDSISEGGNVRKENLHTPNENCYDTLVLSK